MVLSGPASTEVRARDDGLHEQDALPRPQPVGKVRAPPRLALDDEDLEARLLAQMHVGRRPNGPEEVVLPVEDPVGHDPHVMAVHEGDRADNFLPRLRVPLRNRSPDEAPKGLAPARVSQLGDESVEIREQWSLQRNTDSVHGHRATPSGHTCYGRDEGTRESLSRVTVLFRVLPIPVLRWRPSSWRILHWPSPWGSSTATTRTISWRCRTSSRGARTSAGRRR